MRILRSDLLYDVGNSLNPGIDIGQVEGAFSFGVGITSLRSHSLTNAEWRCRRVSGSTNHRWPQRCLWSCTLSCFGTTLTRRACWVRKPWVNLLSCSPTRLLVP